jgi:hypothetical protein
MRPEGAVMHFFYLDETGCTGADLANPQQPIFVLGGISVKDQGWRETTDQIRKEISAFFDGAAPPNVELHASDLLAGKGLFAQFDQEARNLLVMKILDVVAQRKHSIQFIGIDKAKLAVAIPGHDHPVVNCNVPYLIAFNYLVSYIEKYTKNELGSTVRSMIILDKKDSYQTDIDSITHYRRFETVKKRRVKWIVEFSYPVDSARHPMIQVSDLIIFLVRKFLEVENGYKPDWPVQAKNFFASCYDKILSRVKWSTLIQVEGKEEKGANNLLKAAHCTHRRLWKRHYNVE